MKIIQVCPEVICGNDPFDHLSGGKALRFCCRKGFEQSVQDFTAHVGTLDRPDCVACRDTKIYKGVKCPFCPPKV